MFVHITKLGVRLEGVGQVLQDQASDVAVGVDEQGPPLVTGFLGKDVPQGDRQPRLRFAAGFQVWVEEGSFALSWVRSTRISLAVGSSRRFSYISRRARFPLQNNTVNPFSFAQPSTARAPARIIRWGSARMMSFSLFRGLGGRSPIALASVAPHQGVSQSSRRKLGVLEVRRVVGNHCQVVDKSHRTNHQVHPTDRNSLLKQGSPYLAELVGARRVKIENVDFP